MDEKKIKDILLNSKNDFDKRWNKNQLGLVKSNKTYSKSLWYALVPALVLTIVFFSIPKNKTIDVPIKLSTYEYYSSIFNDMTSEDENEYYNEDDSTFIL